MVAGLAVLVVAAIVAVPMLMRESGGGTVAATTTIPGASTELLPWDEDPAGVRLQVTMPQGWRKGPENGFLLKNSDPSLLAFGGAAVFRIFSDRCNWSGTELDTGSTVDDLAGAFATVWGPDASSATAVNVDGFSGKHMVLTVPSDIRLGDCDSSKYAVWAGTDGLPKRWVQGPDQILNVWILDVDGRRILIESSHFPDASEADQGELQQMFDSLQIEP